MSGENWPMIGRIVLICLGAGLLAGTGLFAWWRRPGNVVGALQLDVLKERLSVEYTLPVDFEVARFSICRWIHADSKAELQRFIDRAGFRRRATQPQDVFEIEPRVSDLHTNIMP